MPHPKLYLLIFDAKWQSKENRLVYLETGSAPHSMLRATAVDKVWAEIFSHYPNQPIYVEDNDLKKPTHAPLAEKIIYDEKLLDKIASGKLTQGVFLFSRSTSVNRAEGFRQHYRLADIHIINTNALVACNNKIAFYELCKMSDIAFPKTWLLSKNSFETQKQYLPKTLPQGWIIKPQDSTLGKGTAYIEDQTLPAVLAYLNDRSKPNPLEDEIRFTSFWGAQDAKHQHYPYMLQEMVSSHNPKQVESTFRIVVSITVDETGNVTAFKTLDIIEKFPMVGSKKSSDTVISMTDEVAKIYKYQLNFIHPLHANDPVYRAIADANQRNMDKFIPHLVNANPSRFWERQANALPQPNDYASYLLPRIESHKFGQYDNSTLESFKKILLSPLLSHRSTLLIPFKQGYFGKKDHKLPGFARTDNLFQLIIYFVLHEQDTDLLLQLHEMAENCLAKYKDFNIATDNNDTVTEKIEKDFVIRVKYIIKLLENRLHYVHPNIFDIVTTPILRKFYGPYAHIGNFPTATQLQYLVFDLKWQQKTGRAVYLEIGSAIHSLLLDSTAEKIWQDIFEKFPDKAIYTDEPLTYDATKVTEKYQSNSKIIVDKHLLKNLMLGNITDGLVIFTEAKDAQQAFIFAKRYLSDKVIIINANVTLYCQNKIAFYELCEHAGLAYPATQLMSRQTYAMQKNALLNQNAPGWIVKPVDASNGQGVAYVPKEKLALTLGYLCGESANPLSDEMRFFKYWDEMHQSAEGRQIPWMLQEMVSGKIDNRESTFRVVMAISTDDQGVIITSTILDIVEKRPMQITQDLPENCSRTIVSLTNIAASQYGYSQPFLRILKTTDHLYQSIGNTVTQHIKQFMQQVVQIHPSTLWVNKANPVTQANDYISYMMPKIERVNFRPYNDKTLVKLREILFCQNDETALNRTQLWIIFKYGYFGDKDRPLPQFARMENLFHFIMYFAQSEPIVALLHPLRALAEQTLETDKALRAQWPNPNEIQEHFLLDDATQKNITLIVSVINERLSRRGPPSVARAQALVSAMAYLNNLSYIETKQNSLASNKS